MLVVTNVSYEPLYIDRTWTHNVLPCVYYVSYTIQFLLSVYNKKHYVNKYAKVLDKSIKV
jgi:hypothetical protein